MLALCGLVVPDNEGWLADRHEHRANQQISKDTPQGANHKNTDIMSLNLYHVETSYGLCVQNTHCVSGALHEKSYAGFLVAVGAAVGPLQWQHTKFLFQMKTLILGHLQNALCVMRRHLLLFVLSDGTRLLRPCVHVCVAATTKQRNNCGQVMKTILPNDYWHLQNKFEDSFTHQL